MGACLSHFFSFASVSDYFISFLLCFYFRQDVLSMGVIEVLAYLHDNCLDRDAWEVAEKAIDLLHGITVKLQKKGTEVSSSEGESSIAVKPSL